MPDKLAAFVDYKRRVDPEARFNRGKLMPGAGLDGAYTPSLRLVEQEAIILEETELGALNDDVKHCLRCGKCKPKCMTHVPRANLLYSPRNKILGTGLIIEAFLYEEQTRRGLSQRHFAEMNDVADHCTVCHKCQPPCPVDIDFGKVTMRLRRILVERGKKRFSPGAWAAMHFLNATDPRAVRLMRLGLARWGFAGINLAHSVARSLGLLRQRTSNPAATTGRPAAAGDLALDLGQPPHPGCPATAYLPPGAGPGGRHPDPDPARPRAPGGGCRGGLLLPRLRLGATVLRRRPGDAGHALPPGSPGRPAPRVPVLRLPAERCRAGGERAPHHDG